jgi:peroxiredoxin
MKAMFRRTTYFNNQLLLVTIRRATMQENPNNLVLPRKQADKPKLFDAANIILLLALVIAIFWIVKLTRNQATLKRSFSGVEGTLSGPESSQVGDIVPPFKSLNLSGESAEIAYDGTSKYLLFIFAPTCDVCLHEIPTLNRLSSHFRASGYQVRGISIDSIDDSRQNLKNQELAFDILIMPNKAVQRTYRVVSIPQVMLVTSKGQVEWVHYGALTDDNISNLLSKVSK